MCDTEFINSLIDENIPEAIKEKMDAKSDLVNKTMEIFKNFYSNAVKQTYISQIINGEIIKTNEENIFVDEFEDFSDADNELFAKMETWCKKELYEYQRKAIKTLVQLEQKGYNISKKTGDKFISNGWLLSLPIGSGKSIVFEFLAIFYRNVPYHPIIISTDGHNIQRLQQVDMQMYPYYYENCGYIERDTNAVVVMKGYDRRRCTLILTHSHLLDQMKEYFESDFPQLFKPNPKLNIEYRQDLMGVNLDRLDILVIAANTQNVKELVAFSYQKPFMRVIIDDFTSMNDIETFREILASSTIFVSGSKFQRNAEDIPPSYYTLKHVPINQMSIVGKPEDTLQGILRDNIATMRLMGNSCDFSTYAFINECEQTCQAAFKQSPLKIYPIIRKDGKIKNYIALMFILNHIGRVKNAIINVEASLASGRLKASEIPYYLEWKQMIKDEKENPPRTEIVKGPDGKPVKRLIELSGNPLYNYLYANPSLPKSDGKAVVSQKCYICGDDIDKHLHYGMIAACCGAFICYNCLNSTSTHYIINSDTQEKIYDKNNYYCSCCRERNPVYMFNVNHKRNTSNVHSYYLAKNYFDVSELEGHNIFDYYFYMCLNGFKPNVQEGPPINIRKDIELGIVKADVFKRKVIPVMDKLLPVDHLTLLSFSVINQTFHDLRIIPRKDAIILIYNCPINMQERVVNFYKTLCNRQDKQTMLSYEEDVRTKQGIKKEIRSIQPISNLSLLFKSSVNDLIGLHKNIVAIIQWKKPNNEDEVAQLIGRCLRLNNFNNPLYFFITNSSSDFA